MKTIESDTELAATCNASTEVICAKANEILELISASSHPDNLVPKQPNKGKKTKPDKEDASVMGKLFKLLNATEDPLSRRAVIHLLKHGCKVNDREDDPEKLSQYLAAKRQRIQRLEEQLKAQTPTGRISTEQEAEGRISQAISLPEHPSLMFASYLTWALFCDPTPSPNYKRFIFIYLLNNSSDRIKGL